MWRLCSAASDYPKRTQPIFVSFGGRRNPPALISAEWIDCLSEPVVRRSSLFTPSDGSWRMLARMIQLFLPSGKVCMWTITSIQPHQLTQPLPRHLSSDPACSTPIWGFSDGSLILLSLFESWQGETDRLRCQTRKRRFWESCGAPIRIHSASR
jgi:hypothetical protein